jgi:tetratricopeptide (TPR) repeat protein
MNEMLGNQYFMARNYLEAANTFQNVIEEEPDNINAKKKLIIALSQIGKYSKSLDLFLELIKENVDFILNTDPRKDDCPCAELVNNLEVFTKYGDQSLTTYQTLGTLWLYCDINKSVEYFEKALLIKPSDEKTNSILVILKRRKAQIDANNNLKYPS